MPITHHQLFDVDHRFPRLIRPYQLLAPKSHYFHLIQFQSNLVLLPIDQYMEKFLRTYYWLPYKFYFSYNSNYFFYFPDCKSTFLSKFDIISGITFMTSITFG